MNNTKIQTIKTKLKRLATRCEPELTDYVCDYIDDLVILDFIDGNLEVVRETLQDAIYESHLVGCNVAMAYIYTGIRLNESLQLAYNRGYDLDGVDIETLANILKLEHENEALIGFMHMLEQLYEDMIKEEGGND